MEFQLEDILAVVVTSVALVVTLYLALVGHYMSSKFSEVEASVKLLEQSFEQERSELVGLRIISSIILKFVNESYALSDIKRRQIEDISHALNKSLEESEQIDCKNFVGAIERNMNNFPRIALYAELLSADEEDLVEILDDISQRYPDTETVNYLEALSRLVPAKDKVYIDRYTRRLRRQLHATEMANRTGIH